VNIEEYNQLADEILSKAPNIGRDDSYIIDVMALASWFNCSLWLVDFSDSNALAHISRESSEPVRYSAFISRKSKPLRRRFSIVHEIAHIILHDDIKKNKSFNEWKLPMSLYVKAADQAREYEANTLAAAILMPKKSVEKIWSVERDVDNLAAVFAVPVDVAANRLKELRLLT
jgi:Zn-dependent peptidase ImmA (M78 family)